MSQPIQFDNSYRQLPERFYQVLNPEPVTAPAPIKLNNELAKTLGIDADWLSSDEGIAVLAGNSIPEGAEPIATVYAGHQFGNWNPRLGDGRAVLLGEVEDQSGHRFDLQLKGSGPTLFSRGGDGRAPIGPVIREYLISEAMFRLGVPTSRSLAAVTTGDSVYRDEALPGAVLLRVASSHIRFGTFQYFTSVGDWEAVNLLADHVIARHYPVAAAEDEPYLALYRAILDRTAKLVAKWQAIGFIHGVMNTDNMLISGETIDYGPCAFMDTYHPETVFSSIDVGGRYAYQNQPGIAHWNLAALAQCFSRLVAEDEEAGVAKVREVLDEFPEQFYKHHRLAMAEKIGFAEASDSTDELIRDLLDLMAKEKLDFTNTFTSLRLGLSFTDKIPAPLQDWAERWRQNLADVETAKAIMRRANPVIIPRNHQVEAAISHALGGDFAPMEALSDALEVPYDDHWIDSRYAQAPTSNEVVKQTFCGT